MAASTTLSAEQRRERARKAGQKAQSLETYVKHVVNRAPELTPEQVESLRAIFAPEGQA